MIFTGKLMSYIILMIQGHFQGQKVKFEGQNYEKMIFSKCK